MTSFELDSTVQGKVESWIEGNRGIVALSGEMNASFGVQMSLAAVFFDSGLLGVLNTTHRLTVRAGLKEMSLRNVTSPEVLEHLK